MIFARLQCWRLRSCDTVLRCAGQVALYDYTSRGTARIVNALWLVSLVKLSG